MNLLIKMKSIIYHESSKAGFLHLLLAAMILFTGTAKLRAAETITGNLESLTSSREPFSGGNGSENSPWEINTLSDLEFLSNNPSYSGDYFIQTSNIEAGDTENWNLGTGFAPININEGSFTGEYDGDGYTISNLRINSLYDTRGLFAKIDSVGKVMNLNLTNADIDGRSYSAILAARNYGTIDNCTVSGDVSGYMTVGALTGLNEGTITNCSVSGSVSGYSKVGGIAGSVVANSDIEITNCHSSASITTTQYSGVLCGELNSNAGHRLTVTNSSATGEIDGNSSIGGFTGQIASYGYLDVSACYSTVDVSGVGGIGSFASVIACMDSAQVNVENCYSTGSVTLDEGAGSINVGGFTGMINGYTWQTEMSSIKNCFSTGTVYSSPGNIWGVSDGLSNDQGFAGRVSIRSQYMEVADNFFNGTTSLQASDETATGKTTTELQDVATYTDETTEGLAAAWDFVTNPNDDTAEANIWDMDQLQSVNNGYPILSWQEGADNVVERFFAGGEGTAESPYQISCVEELNNLAEHDEYWDNYFEQTEDIDAADTYNWDTVPGGEAEGLLPIGNPQIGFNGSYNGNGHTISNLYINRPEWNYVGLFGHIDNGAVFDLGVDSVYVCGLSEVGGLVGYGNNAAIDRCYTKGTVSGNGSGVGGLAGYLSSGTLYNSYSRCTVNNSHSYTGGLTGTNQNLNRIEKCYSAGLVNAENGGGMIGYSSGSPVLRSFWDIETSGKTSSGAGYGKMHFQMMQYSIYESKDWDFVSETENGENDYWDMDQNWSVNEGYPLLSWEDGADLELFYNFGGGTGVEGDPWLITSLEELQNIDLLPDFLDGWFLQTVDIDASETRSWNDSTGFEPLGNIETLDKFTGHYNGGGHIISNLYMNKDYQYQGLFSFCENAVIKDLGISDAEIITRGTNSQLFAGVLTSYLDNCAVTGCFTSGSVADSSGCENAILGGIAGFIDQGQISECYSNTSIYAVRGYIAGFCGMGSNMNISNCYSTGYISENIHSGGFIAHQTGTCNVNDSFWNILTSGMDSSANGYGLSTAQLQCHRSFTNETRLSLTNAWDFVGNEYDDTGLEDIWDLDQSGTINNGFPILSWQQGADNILPSSYTFEGSGDSLDPWLITDITDLQNLSQNNSFWCDHIQQTSDINAYSSQYWNYEDGVYKGSTPIGNQQVRFTGVYDGNGHKISGYYINRINDDYQAPFGVVYHAEIKNLGLENVSITGNDHIAGLAASIDSKGFYDRSSISQCFVSGEIFANSQIASIAAYTNFTDITNCYSNCSITGNDNAAGLVSMLSESSIINCYHNGLITCTANSGGVISSGNGNSGIWDSFWNTDTSGISSGSYGTGITDAEMRSHTTFTDVESGETAWDFVTNPFDDNQNEDIWDMDQYNQVNDCYPILTWQAEADSLLESPFSGIGTEESPWQISDIEDLRTLQQSSILWSDYFVLTNDIDATDTQNWNDGAGFIPIGDYNNKFSGKLYGDDHVIDGLTINSPNLETCGLFGSIRSGSMIKDLVIQNATISGGKYCGILCGLSSGSIYDCSVNGTVTGSDQFTGGMVGFNTGYITGSIANVIVNGVDRTGGLVGANNGNINLSSASGHVTGTSEVGGLIGYMYITRSKNVFKCYSDANVNAESNAGGFLGYGYSRNTGSYPIFRIHSCYSSGSVTRTSGSETSFAGFIGSLSKRNSYINVYKNYTVSGVFESSNVHWGDGVESDRSKGFMGFTDFNGEDTTFFGNFVNTQSSGLTAGEYAIGKNTAQMQDVYTYTSNNITGLVQPWDFVTNPYDDTSDGDFWDMDQGHTVNNGYPILFWQEGADNQLYITVTIDLPADTTFAEDTSIYINLLDYIDDDVNDAEYVICTGNTNINVDITEYDAVLSADSNWNGAEELTFTVYDAADDALDSDIINVIVAPVNDTPQIILPDSFSFGEDSLGVVDFSDLVDDIEQGDNLTLTCSGNSHITVDISDLEVQFSAAQNWNGSEDIIFTVNDNVSRSTASDTVNVAFSAVNDAPFVNNYLADINFDEDESDHSIDLNNIFADPDLIYGDQFSFSFSGNSNIAIAENSGVITLTPDENWNGAETIIFTAQDLSNETASDTLVVTISSVNDAPTVENALVNFSFDEDTINSNIDLNDVFADLDLVYGDELVYSYSGNDSININIAQGVVTFTPNPNWYGSRTVTFTATDDSLAHVSDDVLVTVNPVNDDPVIELPIVLSYPEDSFLIEDFNQYIYDVDEDELILTCTGNDSIDVEINELLVTFTSKPDWWGDDDMVFAVNDQQGRVIVSQEILIMVTPVNDAPSINMPDSLTFIEDQTLIYDFSTCVCDADNDDLTLFTSGNSNIDIQFEGLTATFTAEYDWNGSELVTFSVCDSSRSTCTDQCNIIVTPANDAPVIDLPSTLSFDEDGSLIEDFSAYISDVDSSDFTLSVTGGDSISVNIDDMLVTFTAPADWNGSETITFTIDDNNSRLTASDQVTVSVTYQNDAPYVANELPDITMIEDNSYSFSINNVFADPDEVYGDMLSYAVQPAAHFTIDITGTMVDLVPQNNWFGSETITITATDSYDESISDEIIITVENIVDYPQISYWLQNPALTEADGAYFYEVDVYAASTGDTRYISSMLYLNYAPSIINTDVLAGFAATPAGILQTGDGTDNYYFTSAVNLANLDSVMAIGAGWNQETVGAFNYNNAALLTAEPQLIMHLYLPVFTGQENEQIQLFFNDNTPLSQQTYFTTDSTNEWDAYQDMVLHDMDYTLPEFTNMEFTSNGEVVEYAQLDWNEEYYIGSGPNTATNVLLDEGYHPYYFSSTPDGFFEYWAYKGVTESATGWKAHMWQIINGNEPFFYVKPSSDLPQTYLLIDGLQKDFYQQVDPILHVDGDFPRGLCSFNGYITSQYLMHNNVTTFIYVETLPGSVPAIALPTQVSVTDVTPDQGGWLTLCYYPSANDIYHDNTRAPYITGYTLQQGVITENDTLWTDLMSFAPTADHNEILFAMPAADTACSYRLKACLDDNCSDWVDAGCAAPADNMGVYANITVILEGAYKAAAGTMQSNINIPLTSPYDEETIAELPATGQQIIDWIELKLHSATDEAALQSCSAFLLADGSVVNSSGSAELPLYYTSDDPYYLAVNHRNHIPVISSNAFLMADVRANAVNIDLTSADNILGDGIKNMGTFAALYAGDVDGDALIGGTDMNIWAVNFTSSEYITSDVDLDGLVGATDANIWAVNWSKSSSIPLAARDIATQTTFSSQLQQQSDKIHYYLTEPQFVEYENGDIYCECDIITFSDQPSRYLTGQLFVGYNTEVFGFSAIDNHQLWASAGELIDTQCDLPGPAPQVDSYCLMSADHSKEIFTVGSVWNPQAVSMMDFSHASLLNEEKVWMHLALKVENMETEYTNLIWLEENELLNNQQTYLDHENNWHSYSSIEYGQQQIFAGLAPETHINGVYPNPFNPSTAVHFYLQQDADVQLNIYNIKGQKVNSITAGSLPAGEHQLIWEGTNPNNRPCASGVYFFQLKTGNSTQIYRALMLK